MKDIEVASPTLQARVARTLAALREEIVAVVAEGDRHLRAVPVTEHDRSGWYGIAQAHELAAMGYPVSRLELEYPVPAECPWWHDAEVDGRDGRLFRFFARNAWLVLSFAGRGRLEVVVPHGLNGAAMDSLRVLLNGVERVASRSFDRHGRRVLRFNARFTPGDVLRFECDVADVPAHLYPAASDARLLSVAIARPTWRALVTRRYERPRARAFSRRCIHR